MTYALLAAVLLAITVQGAVYWALRPARPAAVPPPTAAEPPSAEPRPGPGALPDLSPQVAVLQAQVAGLTTALERLQVRVEGLPGLWNEAADRAERAAERERAAARRARPKRSDEDQEPDPQLPFPDADGSGAGGLHALPAGVAGPADDAAREAMIRRMIALAPIRG